MSNNVTMADVAREAGVSMMTVSRVVNDREGVGPTTRKRVLAVIERLGYRPSGIARGLATKRTSTLGLVIPDVANPFFADVVRGAEQEAYARGYQVFLCNSNENPERELSVLDSLEEKWVDGVILCSSRLDDDVLWEGIDRFPARVLVNRTLPDHEVGTVLIDDEWGGKALTEHLLQGGRRAIGVLAGPSASRSGRERVKGYRAALAAVDVNYVADRVRPCAPTAAGGREVARSLLADHPEVDALVCYNDLVAVGALQACVEMDRRVPAGVAVTGYDDILLAPLVNPSLTTCRVPRERLGGAAMRLLLEQIEEQGEGGEEIVLRPKLIVRESAP